MIESTVDFQFNRSELANLWITQAQLPGYLSLQQVWINHQGLIQTVQPAETQLDPDVRILDLAGDWISLGGIDLQINGALGLAFPELGPEHAETLAKVCQFLWHQGIDGFYPTIVTTAVEKIQQTLATLANFAPGTDQPAAKILGVHLEGPFLNPQKRGAHPVEYLLPLSIEVVQHVLGDYASLVKVITLAPELDPTGKAVAYLRSLGITVSLGHSLATATHAEAAFDQGATMVTHAFNAMPGLHHREPGLLGAAIVRPGVWCGLIADGQHVCPTMVELLLRASGDAGIFLVSDALAPLGLPDGIYPWDSRQVEVSQGTARLPDGTLAGTTRSLLTGVQNLVRWEVCSVDAAIALATEAPRKAINLPVFCPGQPAAQLLRWHQTSGTGELTWKRLQG